jgi:hypothetical protein
VRADDANAVGRHSATPCLELGGVGPLLVTLVVLSADPDALLTGASASVSADGTVEIRFPDGARERVPGVSPGSASPPGPAPEGRS